MSGDMPYFGYRLCNKGKLLSLAQSRIVSPVTCLF